MGRQGEAPQRQVALLSFLFRWRATGIRKEEAVEMAPSSVKVLVQATDSDTRPLTSTIVRAHGLGSETLDPEDLAALWFSNQGLQMLSSDSLQTFILQPLLSGLPVLSFTSLLPLWPLQDHSAEKSQMLLSQPGLLMA